MSIELALDNLAVYFTTEKYQKEVLEAKAEYFADVGIDDKENQRYEQWMNLFFEWFLFSRPLNGLSLPPARFALEIAEFQEVMKSDLGIYKSLSTSRHSLFRFLKVKKDTAYFTDLISGKKALVKGSSFAETLPKGAICDLRLVELESKELFCTKGFCAHPLDSEKFIKKQVKEYKKKSQQEIEVLLLALVRMFFKLEQYGHLESSQVYTFDSKVRF